MRASKNESKFTAASNIISFLILCTSYLSLSMTAIKIATARPCTRAGCNRPAAGTFSMTDTQPMKTKNIVPIISARQGWNSFSNLVGGLGLGGFLPPSTRVTSVSSTSIFSTPIDASLVFAYGVLLILDDSHRCTPALHLQQMCEQVKPLQGVVDI